MYKRQALIPKNTQTNSRNAFVSGNALADGNSDSSKKADTTIDWIERLTKSLERMFDALKSYAEDLYQTYQNQNAAIDTALAKGNKDVKTFRDASVYYTCLLYTSIFDLPVMHPRHRKFLIPLQLMFAIFKMSLAIVI